MRRVCALAALLTATTAIPGTSSAQPNPSPAPNQQQPQRPARDDVAVYLEHKAREHGASDRAVQAGNAAPRYNAIYNLLREKRPFANSDVKGRDAAQKGLVRDALTRSVAYFLTGIGVGPDDINRMERAGLSPLESASRLLADVPRLEDALVVSPIVVTAKVTSNSPVGDTADRDVTFASERVLKGASPGSFTMRLPTPAHVSNAEVGSTYLLFLSSEYGNFLRAAGRTNPGPVSWVSLPYEVRGSNYEPVSPGQEPAPRTLADVDAFIARHPTIFSQK